MMKNFTLKSFINAQKLLLVAVVVFFSAFTMPGKNTMHDLESTQAKVVKCYPNPAISFVNFEFPVDYTSKGYVIQVYSFTGKKMYESAVSSIKTTLTFSTDFYRGIYIYQLQDKGGKILETGKFQVNR